MVPFLRVEEELKIVTQEGHWDRPELSYSFWSSLIQPIEEQLLERARKSHVENSGDRTCMKFKKWAWEVLHCSGRTPCTRTGWRLTITKKKKTKKQNKTKKNSVGHSPEQPAEMTLLWAGGWSTWSSGVLSYLSHSYDSVMSKLRRRKKSQEYVAFLRKNIFNILLLNHLLWNNASSFEEGDTLKPLCTVPVSPPSQLLQLVDTLKWQEARKMLGYLEHSSLVNSMDSDSI